MAMNPDDKKPRPERDETDASLRTERENTDRALSETRARVEETADGIVEIARDKADAVLDSARDKADDKLDATKAGAHVRDAVAGERAREDEALKDERTAADESLRLEREEQARTLAELLPLERETTDRHLLTERARSDDVVAHRDDFLGMVSHDLRDLMGAITGSAKLLADQASDSDEGRRTVAGMARVRRYIARMNRLVGDLVDVASIDAGKLAMHPQAADAARLIKEATDAFADTAKAKGVSLELLTGDSALPAAFDHDRLLQVLANLITNAIKFTPAGGTIGVRGELSGDALHVAVADTGPGIAHDMLEAIFERFWQVGKNDRRGLGLGLYISKCIVDAHGGRIWAESKPGAGSAFHFTIPQSAGAAPDGDSSGRPG